MRIECEVCSATYTIDDAQLQDQPIGAQCPYCGHVRLVKRGDAGAPQSPPPFGPAQSLGFTSPPPPAQPFGQAPGQNGLGAYGSTGTQQRTQGMPAFGASPFGGQSGTGGISLDSSGRDPSFGAGLSNDLEMSDAAPQAAGTRHSGAQDRFGDLDSHQTKAAAEDGGKCQVCGTALTDEFDKVIGLCDVHQRDRRSQDGGGASGLSAKDAAPRWFARSRDGMIQGPLSLEDLRTRIRQGELGSSDEFSKDGNTYAPISKFQEIAYLGMLGASGEIAGIGRPRSSIARRGRNNVSRAITIGLVVLLVAVISFLVISQREKLAEVVEHLRSSSKPHGPTSPNPLKRLLAGWRLAHPDVSGTAREHLITARARHLEDTWKGYQLAEDAYQRALLLDENDPTAIAGWVENLAIWRYALSSQEEIRTADAAIRYALELAPESPAVHRASAALGLARKELNACRGGADKALEKDATDGIAKLILAGCYMEGNTQLAVQEAERAAKLVPELRRADRVLALAYSHVGRYGSALRLLDQRLKVDPTNGAVHVLFGTLARELAMFDVSEQHYRKAIDSGGDVQEAHLALAEVMLEENNIAGATAEYKKAAEVKGSQGERLGRSFAGLARCELLRDRPKDALKQSRAALALLPRDAEVLLVHGEAALAAGSSSTAAAFAKRALDVRAGEPAALVLAGRAAVREHARDKAIRYFEEAIANDPNDPRIKGVLAAAYLGMNGSQQAYALMKKAAEVDPNERLSRSRTGPLALTDAPVRDAIDGFRRSASDEANASVASSAMGLLYYQLGDRARAQEAISRALRIDDSNTSALLYDSELALDRGDVKHAEAAATRILSLERGAALGHLMLARALAKKGDHQAALDQYANALRSNPGLLIAKVELSGIALKNGERDKAIAELATAYQVNPHSLVVRKLLYEADY
jgi:tetratricopeptide (TPR) repeat protein/DNA-directed RNA polymerase subunit RPC12/RpoP